MGTGVQMRAEGGRRHLGSYLPPEELQKFLQKAEAVTSGSYQPPTPQAAGPAIDQSNLGFRMLQNAGWSAGQGLGAASSGVQAPIAAVGMGSQVMPTN
jgi:splicing factor 4